MMREKSIYKELCDKGFGDEMPMRVGHHFF